MTQVTGRAEPVDAPDVAEQSGRTGRADAVELAQ
jgi:hypothetical protein